MVHAVRRIIPQSAGTTDLSGLKAIIIRMLSFNPTSRPTIEEIMEEDLFYSL